MEYILLGLLILNIIFVLMLLLKASNKDISNDFSNLRMEIGNSIKTMSELLNDTQKQSVAMQDNRFNELKESLKSFEARLNVFSQTSEKKLETIRETVETRLAKMQEDNNIKLEKMRETVDEKLQKTLEERIGKSFKLVSERLEEVYKGLGEMKNLATGVGDLKKVLSNVKTRGILGEIQLGSILEQIFSKEQ